MWCGLGSCCMNARCDLFGENNCAQDAGCSKSFAADVLEDCSCWNTRQIRSDCSGPCVTHGIGVHDETSFKRNFRILVRNSYKHPERWEALLGLGVEGVCQRGIKI